MKTLHKKSKKMLKRVQPLAGQITKFIGAAFLFVSSYTLVANNGSENTASPEKMIGEKIHFPKTREAMMVNEKVKVVFMTDANGNVMYCLAKTQNPLLKSEIEKQFNVLKLTGTVANTVYSVVLNFKTL